MEGLINIYQVLRAQPLIPFILVALLATPLLFQLKTKGRVSWSSWFSLGLTSVVWLVFAIYNVVFRPEPFTAVGDIIMVGFPLLVFSANAVLFWLFGLLSHNRA